MMYTGIRVLLICNNQKTSKQYQPILNRYGIEYIGIAGSDTAINFFKLHLEINQPFDIVLLDFIFPNTDGLTLAWQLHKIDPLILCMLLPNPLLENADVMQEYAKVASYTYLPGEKLNAFPGLLNLAKKRREARETAAKRGEN